MTDGVRKVRMHIRSMALVALVGATVVPLVVAVALLAAVVLLLVVNHWAGTDDGSGTTSEMAAVVTLGLGVLASTRPVLAVALAVSMTVLLVSRSTLHRFVQETVTERERIDALKFFVAASSCCRYCPTGRWGRTTCGCRSGSDSWSC